MAEDIEKLKQAALDAGLDLPEDASGGDDIPDPGEVEEIEY